MYRGQPSASSRRSSTPSTSPRSDCRTGGGSDRAFASGMGGNFTVAPNPPPTPVDGAACQPVGVRVLLDFEPLRDEDVAQVLVQRHDGFDGDGELCQPLFQLAWVERAAEQRLEPAARDDHGVGPPPPPPGDPPGGGRRPPQNTPLRGSACAPPPPPRATPPSG